MKNNSLSHSFAKKIRNGEKVILYELLPPPKNLSRKDLERSLSLFASLSRIYQIDAVNIPEVREETRNCERQDKSIEKCEPRKVSTYLQKLGIPDLIVNRPVVYLSWDEQKRWLEETYSKYGIHNYVFVGGESHTVTYPGYSVTQAVKAVKEDLKTQYPDIMIGGITIPERKNEAERVFKKTQAGIEFFTSQVIYESNAVKKLLKEYWDLCQKEKIEPKTIVLSFAPVTMVRDINLLTWLGVTMPHKTRDYLTTGWLGMGLRSHKICQDIFEDILEFTVTHNIHVPIGLNIEHINQHNFETSFALLDRLSRIFLKNDNIEKTVNAK